MCMGTLDMSFSYQDVFGVEMPEAYQRLLLDCMVGDQTLFARFDAVEVSWQLLTPVLQAWENDARRRELPPGRRAAGGRRSEMAQAGRNVDAGPAEIDRYTERRRASIFSVGTSGGMPPPQERMIRLLSSSGARAILTLSATSSGVPCARTSRGGMFPSSRP